MLEILDHIGKICRYQNNNKCIFTNEKPLKICTALSLSTASVLIGRTKLSQDETEEAYKIFKKDCPAYKNRST